MKSPRSSLLLTGILLSLLLMVCVAPSQAQFGDIFDNCPVNPIAIALMGDKIGNIMMTYGEDAVYILGGSEQNGPLNTAEKTGCYWHFDNGSVYYTPEIGAYVVNGAIRGKYAELGWELSGLGYPVSDELRLNDDADGRISYFQYGAIVWKQEIGAFAVQGLIWEKYKEMRTVFSPLGYPLSDELSHSVGQVNGRYSQFEHGVIIWSPQTGAQPLANRLYECWQDRFAASDGEYFRFPTYTWLQPNTEKPDPYAWFSRGSDQDESWVMWRDGECQSQALDQETQRWQPSSMIQSQVETVTAIDESAPSVSVIVTSVPNPTTIPATTVRCAGLNLPSRLNVGMRARITPGDANNLRDTPAGEITGKAEGGEHIQILEGPQCHPTNNLLVWRVSNAAGLIGWTAEGMGDIYWIEPLP